MVVEGVAGVGEGVGVGVGVGAGAGVEVGVGVEAGVGVGGIGAGTVAGVQAPSNRDNTSNAPVNIRGLWFLVSIAALTELLNGSIITIRRTFVNFRGYGR